jgi:DNA-directed RNA polymerase
MDTQVLQDNITTEHTQEVPYVLPVELEAAIEKHDRRQLGIENREGWGATTGGKAIAKRYLGRLSAAVSDAFENPPRGDRADAHLIRVLKDLDPDVVALAILQTALSAMAHHQDLPAIYHAVGHNLAGECWGAGLTKHNTKIAKTIAKKIMLRHSAVGRRQRAVKAAAAALKKNAFTQRDWDNEAKYRAGAWGVFLMQTVLDDVFTTRTEGSGKRAQEFLDITQAAWDVVDVALNAAVTRAPVFFPSLVPPKAWDAWNGCGPVDPRVNGTVTFLRSSHRDTAAAMRGAIRSGEAQPALDGVNTLQGVAWTINTAILDVINQCAERGISVPGLPQWHDLPIPAKLPDVVWAGMDEDRQRFVRMRKAELHQLNRSAKCDRIMFEEDMKTARDMAVRDEFYTPMNCDWRGRVYAVTHFNFQREDRVRALFQFRDGEPIGEDGLYWLKVHVANCGDFDKISKRPMDERVQWTDQNLDRIVRTAADPFSDTVSWVSADKPFLYLAACMELARCVTSVRPEGVVTHLPVSFDGSCSGLQHLSAMTRAEEGSLVNLTPSELPQDIYEKVADLVRERITLDLDTQPENPCDEDQVKAAARVRELARLYLEFGITRKICKRGVMTFAYSSKKFGMSSQLQVDLMAPLAREVLEGKYEDHPFAPYQDGDTERPSAAARYLGERIFDAIEATAKKPAEAMKFLQKLARTLAHEGKPLRWTTPIGLPWINRYHDAKTKRVELFLHSGGIRVRKQTTVTVGDEADINKDKAANGVAPNFVHALDASHLLLVVNRAASEGVSQIATVHDSFGCLPSRATRFRQIIREEFLRMYETNDVLAQVLSQATCDLTYNNHHMLPTAIEYGSLNLKDVLNADFAFA